jgi:hypothetical protein
LQPVALCNLDALLSRLVIGHRGFSARNGKRRS